MRQLYLEINAPVFNYRNIASSGKRLSCNYLVVKIPNEQQKSELELYGYREVGQPEAMLSVPAGRISRRCKKSDSRPMGLEIKTKKQGTENIRPLFLP